MDELRVGNQVLRYDRESTRRAYSLIESGGAESCGCSYCRNFAVLRSTAYPASFRALLDQLGIDSNKEDEAYECGPNGSLRLYGGWFYLVGELFGQGEEIVTEVESGFQYWFVDARRRPNSRESFGDNVVALEFYTKLPWVIEGDEP